jgi:non-heme chloroperoxidase
VQKLDLKDAVHVGHSTRGGEVSETDTANDLKKFDLPTLFLHGDDDQIVPIGASALRAVEMVKGAKLKVYKGGRHGICTTRKDEMNEDLLAFIKG